MTFAKQFDLTGKTALVTGGTAGLGFAAARALLRTGARVLIAGRSRDSLLDACKKLREEASVGADAVLSETVDLYDRSSVDAFALSVLASTSGIDIFVGNAGAVHTEQFGSISYEAIDQVLQLNLTANITLTQAFVPHMKSQGWGRIIFSSSTASELASPMRGNIAYAATKSGINAYARALAGDLGRSGITVNNILFGMFQTSILRRGLDLIRETKGEAAVEELLRDFTEMTALGRLGDPEELEGLVQLLASDAGRYITGASIPLDGGTSAMMTAFPLHA